MLQKCVGDISRNLRMGLNWIMTGFFNEFIFITKWVGIFTVKQVGSLIINFVNELIIWAKHLGSLMSL